MYFISASAFLICYFSRKQALVQCGETQLGIHCFLAFYFSGKYPVGESRKSKVPGLTRRGQVLIVSRKEILINMDILLSLKHID